MKNISAMPWKIVEGTTGLHKDGGATARVIVSSADSEFRCVAYVFGATDKEREANAALIVERSSSAKTMTREQRKLILATLHETRQQNRSSYLENAIQVLEQLFTDVGIP